MLSSKTKIGLLMAGHVVVGLLLAWASWRFEANVNVGFSQALFGLYALAFAQSGLLGIWGALGTTRPGWRLPAVLAATSYVGALVISADGLWHAGVRTVVFLLNIALPTVIILLLLSGFRHGRRKLQLANSFTLPPTGTIFQFTIRHVLLTTAVVAVVLAIDRGLRTFTNRDGETSLMVFVAVLIPCLTIVALAALWAALGIPRATPRLAIVVPVAFVLGAVPVLYLDNWQIGRRTFITWSSVVGLQAIITAGSLLVVRSCGWRLVRGDRDKIQAQPTPPDT